MPEVKKPRSRRRARPKYQHHPFATSVTVYSPDGSPVPEYVLIRLEELAKSLAEEHNLLVGVNRASS